MADVEFLGLADCYNLINMDNNKLTIRNVIYEDDSKAYYENCTAHFLEKTLILQTKNLGDGDFCIKINYEDYKAAFHRNDYRNLDLLHNTEENKNIFLTFTKRPEFFDSNTIFVKFNNLYKDPKPVNPQISSPTKTSSCVEFLKSIVGKVAESKLGGSRRRRRHRTRRAKSTRRLSRRFRRR
jgi:hypothetical protein